MRFMMMVKANKDSEAGVLPDEKLLSEMGKYNEALVKAGALLAGEGLQASSKGARVRYAKGKVTVIDGPFTETKDLVAGYWLIQAKSMAEAVEWAKQMPFKDGEVEIRRIFELDDFPINPAEKPDGWRDREEQLRAAPQPARRPGTIRFIGLLKGDRDTESGRMPDEKLLAAMGAFFEEGMKSGVILAGEGLHPSSKGARVRYSGNKRTVIDGPFAETKELIAGYAIIQAKSKQEAIEWTKRFVTVDALPPGKRLRDPSDLRDRRLPGRSGREGGRLAADGETAARPRLTMTLVRTPGIAHFAGGRSGPGAGASACQPPPTAL